VTPTELLAVAHELADLADAITLPAFRSGLDVRVKADGSLVTDADVGVERALRAALHRRLPDHRVHGEEDGADPGAHGDRPVWTIDPIDGTTNFVKGNPVFATLIACSVGGRDLAGVVSAPALGSRWDGIDGGPAHQDGRAIRVSSVDDLADAEVSFGDLGILHEAGHGPLVERLVSEAARLRGFGDFWMHCLVAAGSTDVAVETDVKVWDLAAVKVVVEAAGGRFTSLDGRSTAAGGSALSTNGRLHDRVLELARREQDPGGPNPQVDGGAGR
jgi:histidinol-phosphatase